MSPTPANVSQRRPEHHEDGYRDRYCVICGAGPAVALGPHYRRVHGVYWRDLGLHIADVESADYRANRSAVTSERGTMPPPPWRTRSGREVLLVADVQRAARDRRRRWAEVARAEIAAGPGYTSRLARRWRVTNDAARSRMTHLRERGDLAPAASAARVAGPLGRSVATRQIRERRAADAMVEIAAGPGWTQRLASRWGIKAQTASDLLTKLRTEGLLPPLYDRSRRGAIRRAPVLPCGTRAGYDRHRRAGEPECDLCREAQRVYRAERRDEINARQRQRNAKGRDEVNAREREWRAENRDAVNARRRQLRAERRQEAAR